MLCSSGFWALAPSFLFHYLASWPSVLSAFVTAVSLVGLCGLLSWWRAGSSTGSYRLSPPRAFVLRLSELMTFVCSRSVWMGPGMQICHILLYGFWASAHPFLAHYLTSCPSVLPAFVAAASVVLSVIRCVGIPVLKRMWGVLPSPVYSVTVLCDF